MGDKGIGRNDDGLIGPLSGAKSMTWAFNTPAMYPYNGISNTHEL